MPDKFWPLRRGHIVTSGFGFRDGEFHYGTDFGAPGGSGNLPVFAVQGGKVIMAGYASGFGQWVVIDHPTEDGSGTTVYGHVLPEVQAGQRVEAGQRIARINPDSNTNGGVAPHLHLEWHRYAYAQPGPDRLDPLPKLAGAQYPDETPAPAPAAPKPATGGQFACDLTNLTAADDGLRPMPPQIQVIHTNEPSPYKGRGASPGTTAGLLAYLTDLSHEGSYHVVIGRDGQTGRSNDDQYAPWAGGQTANQRGLHLCALGWSAQPRDEWLSYGAQLDGLARVLAHNAKAYGIPLVKLTADQVRAGKRGVCGHGDTSAAWRETDHTDPGDHFPWDVLLAKATTLLNPTPAPTPGGFLMALSDAEQRELYDAICRPRPSLVQGSTAKLDTATFVQCTDAATYRTEREVAALRSDVAALTRLLRGAA